MRAYRSSNRVWEKKLRCGLFYRTTLGDAGSQSTPTGGEMAPAQSENQEMERFQVLGTPLICSFPSFQRGSQLCVEGSISCVSETKDHGGYRVAKGQSKELYLLGGSSRPQIAWMNGPSISRCGWAISTAVSCERTGCQKTKSKVCFKGKKKIPTEDATKALPCQRRRAKKG